MTSRLNLLYAMEISERARHLARQTDLGLSDAERKILADAAAICLRIAENSQLLGGDA